MRPYLNVRMPTYDLSEDEIGKIVRFFGAMSNQPIPYVRPERRSLRMKPRPVAQSSRRARSAITPRSTDVIKPDVNAPEFRFAQSRLKPAWMARLIQTPTKMLPGTNMPPWFEHEERAWVFSQPCRRELRSQG